MPASPPVPTAAGGRPPGATGQTPRRRDGRAGTDTRTAAARRLRTGAGALEIGCRGAQPLGIVAEEPDGGIAVVAEEAAHFLRHPAMIDAEPAARRPLADAADAILLLEHLPVALAAQPVEPPQSRQRVALAVGGVRSPFLQPQRVEALALLDPVDAVVGELARAIGRILGISPPMLLVAERHPAPPQSARPDRSPRRWQAKASRPRTAAKPREGESPCVRAEGSVRCARSPRRHAEAPRRHANAATPRW